MRDRCDICRGSGSIRLPVYKEASARYADHSVAISVEETARSYPCPECSPRVNEENIDIFMVQHDIDSRVPADARDHYVMRQSAHMIADKLQSSGHMKTVVGPVDTMRMTQPVRTTLGVVSQKRVASMEDRVAVRQAEVAEQMVALAIEKIHHWGSHYGLSSINKTQAVASVTDALKEVLKQKPI